MREDALGEAVAEHREALLRSEDRRWDYIYIYIYTYLLFYLLVLLFYHYYYYYYYYCYCHVIYPPATGWPFSPSGGGGRWFRRDVVEIGANNRSFQIDKK